MFTLRKIHKWLALVVGLQILIWGISGLYMTIVNIDIIHGDHLVKNVPRTAIQANSVKPLSQKTIDDFSGVTSTGLTSISLTSIADKPFYQLSKKRSQLMIDATSGQSAVEVDEWVIRDQIVQHYAGNSDLKTLQLLKRYPGEIGGRKKPVWQAIFDDALNSTLYFDAITGKLVSKRSDLWRVFDFLWMLHIMDYRTRNNIENKIFRFFSVLSLVFTLVGWFLLTLRLKNPTPMIPSQALKNNPGKNPEKEAPSKTVILIRKTHRWLGILISLQLFLWVASGVIFTFMDMRAAGGNFLYKNTAKEVIADVIDHRLILERYPEATHVRQYAQLGRTYAKIQMPKHSIVIDQSLKAVEKHNRESIRLISQHSYTGSGKAVSIEQIQEHNDENYKFDLPHWRLTYDDEHHSRIYLTADTGEFLATRTDTWKIFDLLMMVHFMDYFDRGNFNNGIVIFFALLLVFFSLSGILLLIKSLSLIEIKALLNRVLFRKKVKLVVNTSSCSQIELDVFKYENLFSILKKHQYKLKSKCGGAGECRQCWVKQSINHYDTTNIILSCQTILVNDIEIEVK